ncbi:MAG: hypothetical protein GKR94_11885 [Gammaproteobacteria bacterium]|nr:hypothetical protein [Gammaproteobacteria bacterium]
MKDNFFTRSRSFDSLAPLNALLLAGLADEADTRVHGTHGERVIERFWRDEANALGAREQRSVGWDGGYIDVRGNRYSVPGGVDHSWPFVLARTPQCWPRRPSARDDAVVAFHRLRPVAVGWQTVPEHHVHL